jgi:MFS transporter, MHS family, proline/betaine transporter
LIQVFLAGIAGIVGTVIRKRTLLIWSAILIILLLVPLYYSIVSKNLTLMLVLLYLYLFPISCITALLAFVLLHLFAAPVRFTGVGLAFNLSDGLIGGFTPAISIFLSNYFNNPAAFCWFILICAIISLVAYFKVRE